MGNCSSCLGRRRDDFDEDDEARNLFDDPNSIHYGSFDQQQVMGHEDPQEVQREIEALQRVVARTSDNMVDIYDIMPQDKVVQPAPAPYSYAGQEARMARYQTLLSKLSSHDGLSSVARVDWGLPEDDNIEMQQSPLPIKLDECEALVGNFADAAAAMR
ncbi:late endosomal/lysosomal adaptor and MAPK and MTOR activator-domain-containing protein [Lasiosphaeria miniovina]|uniref:Late endosomal/lysosomal adaptor and MAPK and MTOR activator-domain-containing protein n=1 Tax=Lasiosphaeria miniovina TaxID=1954250 RepID=A0AA40DS94_9PEZI|nr:late endosomal/lysosomal adaptor and MAPK and MTOR activator-domain-containing protein [Lasiosphaeria miniovina]KAK0710103.1 late endosomal/lysosomal adaptor and MAPK and MTOR activator-domain-containing protein [Lasiosphaeria miniovina]